MLLPEQIDFDGPFPRLSRRLRLGVVGGGRISGMQATAARLTDRWEVVAGAFSSDPERAKAAAAEWYLPQDRCYASYSEMAAAEAAREDGVVAVHWCQRKHVRKPKGAGPGRVSLGGAKGIDVRMDAAKIAALFETRRDD